MPGDYAAAEAMKALALGLHVMLFSDNVSIAEERAIKTFARAKDLLVMGPDCGTAIVNGVPLGFANVVRRGDIGLVAASGTGLQEVTCRIHNLGGGISQALGTGGRDLKEEIGGITMLQGLAALAADPATRVIVLISKPPAPAIARQIEDAAGAAGKPVVVHFLGAAPERLRAGLVRRRRRCGTPPTWPWRSPAASRRRLPPATPPMPRSPRSTGAPPRWRRRRRRFARCSPAARSATRRSSRSSRAACRAAPTRRPRAPSRSTASSDGHVFLDLGDDDYTRGRPHPMIDPSLRDAAVRTQGADPADRGDPVRRRAGIRLARRPRGRAGAGAGRRAARGACATAARWR